MTSVFEALAAPPRRRILELLADGEQAAGVLVAALRERAPISQPGVSQHLRVLREARLVTVRSEGRHRLYALDPTGIDAAQAWLAQLAASRDPFAQPMDALATEVARGRRARRTDVTAADAADTADQRPA